MLEFLKNMVHFRTPRTSFCLKNMYVLKSLREVLSGSRAGTFYIVSIEKPMDVFLDVVKATGFSWNLVLGVEGGWDASCPAVGR